MNLRNPNPDELASLTKRISRAFGYGPDEPGIERDFPQLYKSNNYKHLWVAKAAGSKGQAAEEIAAHSGFYPSTMKLEGAILPVAGIGGVFTEERFQGQGLATQLVEKCCEEAAREGAALAFLWSDRHDFYARSGFHLAGRQWTATLSPEHAPVLHAIGERMGTNAANLRVGVEQKPTESFLRQSHELLERCPVGLHRTLEEHSLYLGGGACRLVTAWEGEKLAAYFAIGKGRDLPGYVHEWAGAEGALHHLAAASLASSGEMLHLLSPQFMPEEAPFIYTLEKAGVPMRAEYVALVRLLSFDKVRNLVHSYMRRIGLKTEELLLEQENDSYRLCWRGGKPRRLTEKELLALLFGPALPEEEALRAFLPMRIWYWGMDSV